ncbi:unnamed protein product [Allacma fusca]|uniref:Uncharacterized protein n=1 Tax=Allacma fusca TaxID=39272 RepID=A0A8J2KEC9_9HEXA|nr:unnamed protein product [Allacma fusca]
MASLINFKEKFLLQEFIVFACEMTRIDFCTYLSSIYNYCKVYRLRNNALEKLTLQNVLSLNYPCQIILL